MHSKYNYYFLSNYDLREWIINYMWNKWNIILVHLYDRL